MTSEWQRPLSHEERAKLAVGFSAAWEDQKASMPLLDMIGQWEHTVWETEEMLARCGSPIERMLIFAIVVEDALSTLTMSIQRAIGPYKADIAFGSIVPPYPTLLVVECDGAAYHAATAEQVSRDKKRDRFFTAQGVSVMRFTGSEIWRDARACAREALSVFRGKEAQDQERRLPVVGAA